MKERAYARKEDYIYASARVRLYEKRLISFERLRQFFDAENTEQALRMFRETAYGLQLRRDEGEEGVERVLLEERDRLFREVEEAAPGSPGLSLLTLEDDYHNLKVIFKNIFLGQKLNELLFPVHQAELNYYENLYLEPRRNPAETPREKAIRAVTDDWEKNRDPWRAELILDHSMFRELDLLVSKLDSPVMREWLVQKIDFYNLESFLRFLRLGVDVSFLEAAYAVGGTLKRENFLQIYREGREPEEKDFERLGMPKDLREAWQAYRLKQDPSAFELLREEAAWQLARRAAQLTYGPEVLFAYWLRRELEITALRTLFMSLKSDLSREERRAHLPLLRG